MTLAAGEFVGETPLQALQAEQLQQPVHPLGILAAAQPEAGVGPGIEVGEEGVVLEHHAHPPPLRRQQAVGAGHLLGIDPDSAPLRLLEAGDQPQQGGFATTGGAQQAEQLTAAQLQIHPPQGPGVGGAALIAMPKVLKPHPRLMRGGASGGVGRSGGGGTRGQRRGGGGAGKGDRRTP